MSYDAQINCWMQTYTGSKFYPLAPVIEDIHLADIAGALSKMCRFGGHCIKFYSVAEHCVHVAEASPEGLQLAALLHDASEAYLVDIIRPLKPHLRNYYEIEDRLNAVIAERFDLPHPLPLAIKQIDNAILRDEREQNMAFMDEPPVRWGDLSPPIGVTLQYWAPAEAYHEFVAAFLRYAGRAAITKQQA